MSEFYDEHHIVHNRQEWTLRPEAKVIRETKSLRPIIPRSLHNEIHAQCPPVPLLGYHALLQVRKHFEPTRDTLETVDNLCFAIEEASRHPRFHPLERDLAELTVEAIRLQIPQLETVLRVHDAVLV